MEKIVHVITVIDVGNSIVSWHIVMEFPIQQNILSLG